LLKLPSPFRDERAGAEALGVTALRKVAQELPAGFELTANMVAAAEAVGWDKAQQKKELGYFVNYYQGYRSFDWTAVWADWVRGALPSTKKRLATRPAPAWRKR
jgi:hypothetical protein